MILLVGKVGSCQDCALEYIFKKHQTITREGGFLLRLTTRIKGDTMIILLSGDGDYKLLVDFLIEENKFEKILFPDRSRASSLYKKIGATYFDALDGTDVRNKIEQKKKPP